MLILSNSSRNVPQIALERRSSSDRGKTPFPEAKTDCREVNEAAHCLAELFWSTRPRSKFLDKVQNRGMVCRHARSPSAIDRDFWESTCAIFVVKDRVADGGLNVLRRILLVGRFKSRRGGEKRGPSGMLATRERMVFI